MAVSFVGPGSCLAIFLVTNIDSLVLFLIFASDRSYRIKEIVLGQFIALAGVIIFSATASLTSPSMVS